jgi:SAM-dependent methyltransferase
MVAKEIVNYYDCHAKDLARLYESVSFIDVHKDVLPLLPPPPCNILDIGTGSGRDAAWLSQQGYKVTAVDPSIASLEQGKNLHKEEIRWLNDSLPQLSKLYHCDGSFSVILANAVFQHLQKSEIDPSIRRIFELLGKKGLFVISLKISIEDESNITYPFDKDYFLHTCSSIGFSETSTYYQEDIFGRNNLSWLKIILVK